jgi:hypothetical protein
MMGWVGEHIVEAMQSTRNIQLYCWTVTGVIDIVEIAVHII